MTHIKILSLVICVLSLVTCEPPVSEYQGYHPGFSAPATNYLPPRQDYTPNNGYLPPNAYDGSSYDHGQHDHHHNHGSENEVPKSYEFGYSVKDIKTGNDYGRREMSDGNVVRGEYRVQLPDGRTQIVTYHADWLTGYHADVRYEGEPTYPEPSNQGYNYNAPNFAGSITGFHSAGRRPASSYGSPVYH